MVEFFRRKRTIPYKMFDRAHYGLEAKNARILERIYHKGQALAWDGKEVLESLISEHGTPKIADDKKEALSRIFGIIMWGELAAWRISAELADELEPLEAKLAATSQAFDEARHFYVMHDYLTAANALPKKLEWGPRALLEGVMNADHLTKKLMGMQLMVEPIALTLFHFVKKMNVEPVLTHLLPYYERDEARHVALGIQYLPAMLTQMTVPERISLFAHQFRLLTYEVWSNSAIAKDMLVLGVDPRELMQVGQGKQTMALNMVFSSMNMESDFGTRVLNRYASSLVCSETRCTGGTRTIDTGDFGSGHTVDLQGQSAPETTPEEIQKVDPGELGEAPTRWNPEDWADRHPCSG
jgi:hypothetical protein